MRKAIFALPFLLVVVSWAQSSPPFTQQIAVRNVTLHGVTQLSPTEQQEIISGLRKAYDATAFSQIDDTLREAVQSHGFYKASVGAPKVTVVSGSEQNGTVDLAFNVVEGQRYRLKQIVFTNNRAFSPERLRGAFSLSNGDVFSTAEARRGFEVLRRLYVSHGYIDFVPFPELIVDEPAALITMRVDLSEGVPFSVGTLAVDGAESMPETIAKLRTAWKKYQGRTYSGDMLSTFVRENASYLPKNETETQLFRIVVNEEAHILDFRLDLGAAATAVSQ